MNVEILQDSQVFSMLKKRATNANKGDLGHVLIIGGDHNMGGATIIAAEASFRAGAGRVTVLTRKENFSALLARLPNAMTASADNKEEAKKIFANKDAVAIGMGLGQSPWAQEMLAAVLECNLPKVIDADALNLIAPRKIILQNAIITPHPKEAARLLSSTVEIVQNDRLKAAQNLHEKYHAVAILKGHDSLIADQNQILLCPYGNAGMAVAGMGDALCGVIATFLAQKFSLKNAAILGTTIHALAGDQACQNQGQVGILPTELLTQVAKIINDNMQS